MQARSEKQVWLVDINVDESKMGSFKTKLSTKQDKVAAYKLNLANTTPIVSQIQFFKDKVVGGCSSSKKSEWNWFESALSPVM